MAARTQTQKQISYAIPRATGGRLIRRVIRLLREYRVQLPIGSHIHIATSGGSDSIALAHLLIHYGRRVGPKAKISLLHINHGWRGKESDADEQFVRTAARRWGVKIKVVRLRPPKSGKGESWEDLARVARKKVYAQLGEKGAVVFTAHHGDDLAETLLWRIFTGSHETHGGGIAVRTGAEVRPFLGCRKQELQQYLEEEGESWREDRTNFEGRFLRSRIRLELIPVIQRLFPKATDHLIAAALKAQAGPIEADARDLPVLNEALGAFLGAAGLRIRRAHWGSMLGAIRKDPAWHGELHLPGGWKIRREKSVKPVRDRWVLERLVEKI